MPSYIIFLEPAREAMPDDPTDAEAEAVNKHFHYLKRLTEEGVVRLAGRTIEAPHRGIVIFDAESREAAQAIMNGDAAISAGVFKARLAPFGVALERAPKTPA
jgi:uncharacterized protein YciI